MKQAFINKGNVSAHQVPEPTIKKGYLKIAVVYSTISSGTEMSTVKGTGKTIIQRAINDPAKVVQVLDILKSQGLKSAQSKVAGATERLSSMGYSVAGQVIEVGEGIDNFVVGDLVAAGGSGFAVHAGIVVVPKNLVVKVPLGLDLQSASTGTVGSIALHGVRRADLRLGEYGVVLGAGLLGLLALQMLNTSGVKTACIDINPERLALAKKLGADLVINPADEDPVLAIQNWSAGHGADAVLFMAATDKDEPLSQAFRMCRRKGRVVLVGVSGMNVNRNDIYRDEIDLMISTSYGPGRYDNSYELDGHDYPYAYVRWTENRNIAAYLQLIRDGKINLEKLKPLVYTIDEAGKAYHNIENDPDNHILTILKYDEQGSTEVNPATVVPCPQKLSKVKVCIGLIGAGSFATSTLLPIIYENSDKFYLKTVVNSTGDKAVNVARQFKAEKASTDLSDVFNDADIDLVLIATRHNSHADLVTRSLQHNKHVFVEKPLATTLEELNQIEEFFKKAGNNPTPLLMVGFNRRFSKYTVEIRRVLENRSSPALLHYRMNSGFVPYDTWVHESGGRIVGEACHLIDLMLFLTGSEVTDYSISSFNPQNGKFKSSDNRSITFTFIDGSVAVIDYFACGSKQLSKEYLEVHFDGKSVIMDDYKSLRGFDIKLKELKSSISEKGHKEEWETLYQALKTGAWPISLESLLQTTRLSILLAK